MSQPRSAAHFSLRRLFAFMGCIACLLATAKVGVWPFVSLGLPICLLVVYPPAWSLAVNRCPTVLVTAAAVGLLVWQIHPADQATLLAVLGWMLCGVWLAVIANSAWHALAWQAVPAGLAVLCLSFAAEPHTTALCTGVTGDCLMDLRGGRRGVDLLGLRFTWPGPETAVIEQLVGPRPAEWRASQHGIDGLFLSVRDGDERRDSRSPIFGGLGECLVKLPHNAARRQVVEALTNPDNCIRSHQALLLVCLREFDYPPGYNAESWWEKHRNLFRSDLNAQSYVTTEEAVQLVYGWRHWVFDHYPCSGQKLSEIHRFSQPTQNELYALCTAADHFGLGLIDPLDPCDDAQPGNVAWWPEAIAGSATSAQVAAAGAANSAALAPGLRTVAGR